MKGAILVLVLSFTVVFSVNLNLSHLEFLRDEFDLNGKKVVGYWVYAEKRGIGYERVGAEGEGITCVDDVARAAILYSELYELEGKNEYASRAKEALEFVISMQDEDGDFYNFLEPGGRINRSGPTSRKSGNWWAVRALWAMAKGARVLKGVYPDLSRELVERSKRAVSAIEKYVRNGLLHDHTSISSVFVLGLAELYRLTGNAEYLKTLREISREIVKMQVKDGILRGFISDSREEFSWHGWGSRYLEALVEAYRLTGDESLLDSARLYADNVGMFILVLGPVYSIHRGIRLYPQLSYAAECEVSGLVELYKATGDDRYAIMASLTAGFLFKNNVLRQAMMGPNGEGYDGLHSVYINRNAGAESTISALRMIEKVMELKKFEDLVEAERISSWGYEVLEAEKMDTGISDFRLDMSDGLYLLTDTSLRLKKTIRFHDDRITVYAFLKGKGKVDVKVFASGEKSHLVLKLSETPKIWRISEKIDVSSGEGKLVVYFKTSGELGVDQIVIVGERPFIVVKMGDENFEFKGGRLERVVWKESERSVPRMESLVDVKIIGRFAVLNLTELFNNNGISGERERGNFDNPDGVVGASYSREELKKFLKNGLLKLGDVPFALMERESGEDNIACFGQRMVLKEPLRVQRIYVLGSSDHGNYSSEIVLGTGSGRMEKKLEFSDWCGEPVFGERVAVEMPYRYISNGQKQFIKPKLFVQVLEVGGERIDYVELPVQPTMHIFAITFEIHD